MDDKAHNRVVYESNIKHAKCIQANIKKLQKKICAAIFVWHIEYWSYEALNKTIAADVCCRLYGDD